MAERTDMPAALVAAKDAAATAGQALTLCSTLRRAAADTPTCRRDCRTLSRFAGKVMLILEALQPLMLAKAATAAADCGAGGDDGAAAMAPACSASLAAAWSAAMVESRHQLQARQPFRSAQAQPAGDQQHSCLACEPAVGEPAPLSPEALQAAWAEAVTDICEALAAAAELVATCQGMGRLQAVMEAEEMRDRFAAASRDLGLALSGLQALVAADVAPADVAEDVTAVQRQLGAVRFSSATAHEQLPAQLLQAVVLHHLRRCELEDGVAPLLREALRLASLDLTSQAWLDFEVARLRDAAAAAARMADPITEFLYKQVLMCLLALQCSTMGAAQEQRPAKRQQDQQAVPLRRPAAELAEQASAAPAAVLQHEASNGSSAAGVGTPPVCAGTPQKCDSDGSSLLLAADEVAGSGAGTAPSSAERGRQQQQGKRAARLQLLMNTWEEGRSSSSSAQPSPGATAANGTGSPQRHHLLMGGSTPHSPLSEDTLSSLMGAFQPEGEDALRGLDPADAGTVVAALQAPSELAQFAAAVLIEQRVESGSDTDRAELVGLGAVPKLLRVMQASRQPLLRASVALCFRQLARDGHMRQQLAAAGAIPALSLLLQSPSSIARQAAARAISNLVVNCEANKIEAAKFGTIHSLARMLEVPEAPLMQEAAASALGNLAANSSEAQALIASAGAIPLLVGVLRSGTPAAKQHATRAIRNLAGRDTSNKLRTAEAGGIPLLVAMMAGCGVNDSDASRQAAASALSNIACNCEQTQKQIVAEGALPVVCDMLLPSGGCGMAAREAAAWLLSNLACSAEVRAQLAKDTLQLGAAVTGLLNLLRSGGDSAGAAAARAIKNLSAGQSNSSKVHIAEAGAVPLLVALLRSPKDATRKAAASALWNLAYRNNSNRKAIVLAGAIPLLVQLLQPSSSEGCRQEAARALSNLSCNNDVDQGGQMVAAGAVPLLVDMMRTSSPAGKEAAVGAISNLACIRAHQQAILEAGAAPLLLTLMQPGSSAGCMEAAARGFGNLVCDSLSDTLRLVAYQAVPLLVGIVAGPGAAGLPGAASGGAGGGGAAGAPSSSDGARQAAARAISNLVCCDVTTQVLVAKSGAASALVELCRSPNEALREAAAVALWDLAYDSSLGREAVARAGAVPWLSQLLLFGGTGAKEAAAACLAELAAVGPAVQQQIREAGAVQLLESLQRSDVPEVAMACTEALRSLEVNSSRDTSRNSSVAAPPQAAAAEGAAAARAVSSGSGSGASGPAVPTMTRLGTWSRRGSQSIPLEQVPPEVAAAEAGAEESAGAAAPPAGAAPPTAGPASLEAAAAAGVAAVAMGPANSGPLSPPGLPRPPSRDRSGLVLTPLSTARDGQPQVQSVPLPTSPFAGDVALPSPSLVE
ncbi:hypothetical protein ABPG77_004080 [Micractinium sp. CCAP 211/92]